MKAPRPASVPRASSGGPVVVVLLTDGDRIKKQIKKGGSSEATDIEFLREWRVRGMFDSTGQRFCDQSEGHQKERVAIRTQVRNDGKENRR